MFGLKKSPLHRFSKHNSADSGFPVSNHANPFDSDDELDTKKIREASARTSSEPSLVASNLSSNPFDDDETKRTSSTQWSINSSERNRYKNDFRDSGGLENQTVQELENYAVYKAEETTKSVNGCLKIAEEMREDATKTLVTLHQQGEQITRTHMVAADMDHDLSRGEKLLGSLGGIFSKTWKPKKTRPITGPLITRDDAVYRKGNHLEQRERLGLTSASKERSHTRKQPSEPTNALQKVEVEKVKQEDALADLSNILGELKDMAIDMGSEIE
ncbi:UNVERIFIED_CONTAM: SNAP25 homologous protein SNAP33, partial [Sesamum calycinum]